MSISEFESIASAMQAAVTVLALIVAGLWTYLLFIRHRQSFPRAGLQQTSIYRNVDQDTAWLRVSVVVENTGQVLLRLSRISVWVQQLVPWPPDLIKDIQAELDPVGPDIAEYLWPLVGEKEIEWLKGEKQLEPGESESLHLDFFIPAVVEEMMIYTHLENSAGTGKLLGWSATSIANRDGHPASLDRHGTSRPTDSSPEAHLVVPKTRLSHSERKPHAEGRQDVK